MSKVIRNSWTTLAFRASNYLLIFCSTLFLISLIQVDNISAEGPIFDLTFYLSIIPILVLILCWKLQ